jgi:hypothetical protein
MESRLVDLAFDELDAQERRRLLSEIEACDDCLSEYRSMSKTLLIFDQTVETSVPDESYWPEYRDCLRQRLAASTLPAKTKRTSLWRRLLTAKLPVPVPVAALVVIALLTATVFALRPATKVNVPAISYSLPATPAPPEVVEVPVIREKVVKRTVYVEKRAQPKNAPQRHAPIIEWNELPLTARNSAKPERQAGIFTRASLTNYQPPDEMKIRIIKRRNQDEN